MENKNTTMFYNLFGSCSNVSRKTGLDNLLARMFFLRSLFKYNNFSAVATVLCLWRTSLNCYLKNSFKDCLERNCNIKTYQDKKKNLKLITFFKYSATLKKGIKNSRNKFEKIPEKHKLH